MKDIEERQRNTGRDTCEWRSPSSTPEKEERVRKRLRLEWSVANINLFS